MKGSSFILVLLLAGFVGLQPGVSQPFAPAGSSAPKAAFVTRPPSPNSPIDFFRKLLTSSAQERELLLMEKSAAQRTTLLAKINEYEAFSPAERELRLRQLQLHYYLMPLMRLSPRERSNQVETIPLADRHLVEERLRRWDMLPPPLQKELLEYETTRSYFLRLERSSPSERKRIFGQMPPRDGQQAEATFKQWIELPESERQIRVARFNQFFDLSEEERQKVLGFLPSEERRQTEPIIIAFEKLPEEERQRCLESFRRFANLSAIEQQRFLETAQRWRTMPAPERQAWRDLVTTLPNLPPLPPGMIQSTNR